MTQTIQPVAPQQKSVLSTYQIGVFALIKQENAFLLVRPHQLLLPGGPQSLPGTIIHIQHSGIGIIENTLRRTILTDVGISVGSFRLIGSHATRSSEENPKLPRLNMIFGSDYCSGILQARPSKLKTAHWFAINELEDAGHAGKLPQWLRAAMQEMLQSRFV